MRISMIPLVALAVVPATPAANACGYVTPAVFVVSTHELKADRANHALVRLHDAAPNHLAWEQANPMSYDSTEIAPAPQLDRPMTFTLAGPHGNRVVASALQRFIARDMWSYDAPASASVDVGDVGSEFRIALAGSHRDATFHDVRGSGDKLSIDLADAGTIDVVEDFAHGGFEATLLRDGRTIGTFPGRVLGGLDTDGNHYVVIEDKGNARAIAIW
jgi:hypothetical protein